MDEQASELKRDVEKSLHGHKGVCHALRDIQVLLIGIDGENGMRSEQKLQKQKIEKLEIWKYQFMAIIVIIQLLVLPIVIALALKYLP